MKDVIISYTVGFLRDVYLLKYFYCCLMRRFFFFKVNAHVHLLRDGLCLRIYDIV